MSKGLLLDTVTFVEFLQGTLPASVRQAVEQSHRRFLSVITPWEIQMKKALRERIRPMDITAAIEQMGLEIRTVLLGTCGSYGVCRKYRNIATRLTGS